jgi:short-subunit dehydrogenase
MATSRTTSAQRRTGRATAGGLGFPERYGAWALVAGASEGLGAAYARALAESGMNLVLVARRRAPLDALGEDLHATFGVEVRSRDGDLASGAFLGTLQAECSGIDLGLIVCNAAQAPIGDFASRDTADLVRVVDVNVRAPLLLLRALLPEMTTRGRGAVIIMTSFTGHLGTPRIAAYAASKAFLRVLGEGLWYELKDRGIDVVACSAGAVRTPGYAMAAGNDAPGTLDAERVVNKALRALGRGPVVMPGFVNRVATVFMTRLLPKRAAIAILAGSTEGLADLKESKGTP